MAFQGDVALHPFLKATARSGRFPVSAPAVNFLLEERLKTIREANFVASKISSGTIPWDEVSWLETFSTYYDTKIARPKAYAQESLTFSGENKFNGLNLEKNQQVVRLESINTLNGMCPTFGSPANLAAALERLIESRQPGKAMLTTSEAKALDLWLRKINGARDARPSYATPYGEVRKWVEKTDWAIQLRNIFGLPHFAGTPSNPFPVLLCRYSLARVEWAAKVAKVPIWAAIPTVLEAGNHWGPGTAFFPFPQDAQTPSLSFGVTVNMDPSPDADLTFNSEIVHFRIDYELDDFIAVGWYTDQIEDSRVAKARQRHFDLIESKLRYRSDVP